MIYILSDKKIKNAKNIQVIEIDFIENNIDFTQYDALIFTSKNAIYSIDYFSNDWKKIPTYAIAKQTAKVVDDLLGNLQFIGKSSHGNEFAIEIKDELKNKKVLYIRGEKVLSDIVEILRKDNIECDEVITYKTACKSVLKNIKLENNSIIIFSSPSTIKCFFNNFDWHESFKAVVIGKTTLKYIPKDINVTISDETSLDSCVNKAIELSNML